MRRLLALLLGTALALLLQASPAWAHAALLTSDPQDGVVLDTAPREVVLTFNQPVGIGLGAVRVVGPDGERADGGAPELRDGGRQVVAALPYADRDGTYVLLWRVLSEDSHPVSGASTFSVGSPSTPAATVQAEETGTGTALRAARLVGYVGLLLLVGAVVVPLVAWPAGLLLRPVRRLQAVGWSLALLGSSGTLLAQGPNAAGLPLTRAVDLLPEVLGTRYGTAHVVRLALLLVLGVLLIWLRRARTRERVAVAAVGLPLLVTWSLAGHPAAGDLRTVAVPLDALHLLAVGTWTGGLVVLLTALLRRRDLDELRSGLGRWSRLATVAVSAMVLTGLFAGWREVRSIDAFGGTDYGRLLLLKTVVVIAMLYAGARGRHLVGRHVAPRRTVVHAASSELMASPTVHVQPEPDETVRRSLRRSTLAEAGLAAVVVLVTTVLVDTPPAVSAYARPLSVVLEADDALTVQLDLDSARVGPNTLHVYLTTTGGRAIDVPEVTGRITRDDQSVPVAIRRISLGHYEATQQLVVPYAGQWDLEVVVRRSDIESDTVRQTLTIR